MIYRHFADAKHTGGIRRKDMDALNCAATFRTCAFVTTAPQHALGGLSARECSRLCVRRRGKRRHCRLGIGLEGQPDTGGMAAIVWWVGSFTALVYRLLHADHKMR